MIGGGIGLLVMPQVTELLGGVMLQVATLCFAPYLLWKTYSGRFIHMAWLVGGMSSNLLGAVVAVLELSGQGFFSGSVDQGVDSYRIGPFYSPWNVYLRGPLQSAKPSVGIEATCGRGGDPASGEASRGLFRIESA